MKVSNIHRRVIDRPKSEISPLLDSLGSRHDKLWPKENWSSMKCADGLNEGAKCGHGPIRYTVLDYQAGVRVLFQFTKSDGWSGTHCFELIDHSTGKTMMQHTLEMETSGAGTFKWLFVFRWLHDAILEDALDNAENYFHPTGKKTPWNLWVRFLRKVLKPRKVHKK